MKLAFDTSTMSHFIKELLTTQELWTYRTINDSLTIEFTGDTKRLEKDILEWLKNREATQL